MEAVKLEEYRAGNTKPWVTLEYSEVVQRAAVEYTPKIFAMFQEQYLRIQEYQIDQNTQVIDSSSVTCSVYKFIDRGRSIDVRVVQADTQSGKGTFGNIKLKTLAVFYIKKRWARQ
ncbi:hypothetical protein LINPERPRIM_LOCUS22641, partial [Linum perenne]